MKKIFFAFPLMVLLAAAPAFAQYARVIQSCSRDFTKFCAAAKADGGYLADCVETSFPQFSPPCQAALTTITDVREACAADIRDLCPATKPGAGRVLLCVKRHFTALSDRCKWAIGQAAERQLQAH